MTQQSLVLKSDNSASHMLHFSTRS